MPHRKREQHRRLAVAKLMVEVLRPVPGDADFTLTDRLVGYCVVISTFGPLRMGVDKITALCGLPRSTVRSSLKRLVGLGAVVQLREGYVVDPTFSSNAARALELDRKVGCILAAADEILSTSGPISPAQLVDTAEAASQNLNNREKPDSGK